MRALRWREWHDGELVVTIHTPVRRWWGGRRSRYRVDFWEKSQPSPALRMIFPISRGWTRPASAYMEIRLRSAELRELL